MSWVRLDDGFFRNPKMVAAGKDGRSLYFAGLCYASANLTDGAIPKAALRLVAADAEVRPTPRECGMTCVGCRSPIPDQFVSHPPGEPMSPERLQRRRTKGWRMPAGAVYVGRPTKWGNPFLVGHADPHTGLPMGAADAVAWFRAMAERCDGIPGWDTAELAGRDLVCWCRLMSPCHADVLLGLANGDRHFTKEQR